MSRLKSVIFTGPDCAGKSSIVQALSHAYEDSVILPNQRVPEPFNVVLKSFKALEEVAAAKEGEAPIIFDRLQFPDDIIYEPLFNERQSILAPLIDTIMGKVIDNNMMIVFVVASPSELLRRYELRGDELRTGDEILKAAEEYRRFFAFLSNKYPKNVATIDTTYISIEEATKIAMKIIERGVF